MQDIEGQARNLQLQIWNERHEIWKGSPPDDPVLLLEPGIGLEIMGFEVQTVFALGQHSFEGRLSEAAGLIDHNEMVVRISSRFSEKTQRFTAAHELGHAVLHDSNSGMLRDFAVSGPTHRRDPREAEADKFASCFLMPRRLLARQFMALFGCEQIIRGDARSFAVHGASHERTGLNQSDGRGLSLYLARAIGFDGRYFKSLAEQFKVSDTAMAIRLEELGLVGC